MSDCSLSSTHVVHMWLPRCVYFSFLGVVLNLYVYAVRRDCLGAPQIRRGHVMALGYEGA